MQIRFETTIDDVLALRRIEFRASLAWRIVTSFMMLALIFGIGLLWILFMRLMDELGGLLPWILASILASATLLAVGYSELVPKMANWACDQATRKSMTGVACRSMLGWHELDLVDGYLLARSELMDCKFDMRAIEKIVGDGEHMFVFVASGPTFIIPLTLYPERQFHEFVAELRDTRENGFAGPPTVVRAERLPGVDERIEELH